MIDMRAIMAQGAEFAALAELAKSYDNLPAIVDDDYPEFRHYYESKMQTFLRALKENGRVPAISAAPTDNFVALREANQARQAEWETGNQIDLSYRGDELGGECGEAQNEIKKLERERLGIRGSRSSDEKLGEELADVIICVDLICMMRGIDLWAVVRDRFNKTSEKVGLETKITCP